MREKTLSKEIVKVRERTLGKADIEQNSSSVQENYTNLLTNPLTYSLTDLLTHLLTDLLNDLLIH